ncbi:MAG: hypothetical protein Q9168_001626 [Polycauliona sp. 1 TL-2023]
MTESLSLDLVGGRDEQDDQNNNEDGAIPHTFGAYDHVTEVDYVSEPTSAKQNDQDKNDGAVPHTFGAYDHVTEVDYVPDTASAEQNHQNSKEDGAVPHTFGAYDHVTEVEYVPESNRDGAIPHTFGAYNHVTEVEWVSGATSTSHDDNKRDDGAVPHTFGAYEHVTEVEQLPDNSINDQIGVVPHTFGAYNHVTEVEGVFHNNQNRQDGAIPHTFGAYNHVTEVEQVPANDQNNKDGAIPHTFGAYKHVTEVEQLPNNGQNSKDGAIPHTFGAYNHVTEVDHQKRGADNVTDGGRLRLRGEDLPRGVLTQAQRESYHKDGYIVLPHAFDESQGAAVLEEARNVIKRISTGGAGITRHDMSGNSGAKRPSPIGRVLATFEPEDKSSANVFERRIARLGLGVHQKLPTFRALSLSAFNRSVAKSLGYSDPRITQSQLIAKLAGIGGHLVPHQDGAVSFSNPPSAMTFWYALEDSTLENGCLCVAKGSHLTTPLTQRLTKLEDGFPKFVHLPKPLWAKGVVADEDKTVPADYEYEALEVKKGTLILFHGNLMHKSEANKSEKSRMAYTFSIIDGVAECPQDSYVMPEAGTLESLA